MGMAGRKAREGPRFGGAKLCNLGAPWEPPPSRTESRDHQEGGFEAIAAARLRGAEQPAGPRPRPPPPAGLDELRASWMTLLGECYREDVCPATTFQHPVQLRESKLQAGARAGRGAEWDQIRGEEGWGAWSPGGSQAACWGGPERRSRPPKAGELAQDPC